MSWVSVLADRPSEPQLPSWSKKTLFSKTKHSDEWRQQIDFIAGTLRPADPNFPWLLLKKHTDNYLKKKGKISQTEVDIRLALLIDRHETKDIAIAACAHAISPGGLRALLNVELHVAPVTYYGLETHLQCLIAVNHCSPNAVSDLEAQWARWILPYVKPGSGAAGSYLEGMCEALRGINTPNLNILPDFAILARKAFKDFATQLEGFQLRCQWVSARAATAWMAMLLQITPAVTPPGHLLPIHVLDAQFPIWRIWAAWKPNMERIKSLNGMDSSKRGVLPDLLALEGPDFIDGTHATLRDGLVAQYSALKPIVRFRNLVLDVPSCTKDELEQMLDQTGTLLAAALRGNSAFFNLFIELTVLRPITLDALQLIQAMTKVEDTPTLPVHNAVLEIYLARHDLGGGHISVIQHAIRGLNDVGGDDLRKFLLRPWFVRGIEQCVKECYAAVRIHIGRGLSWIHLATELHTLCAILKGSHHCLPLLDACIRKQLDILPITEDLNTVFDIYASIGHEKIIDTKIIKSAVEAWCIDRLVEQGTISPASEATMEAILGIWYRLETAQRKSLALIAWEKVGLDSTQRDRCWAQCCSLPEAFVDHLLTILLKSQQKSEVACVEFTKLLADSTFSQVAEVTCWKPILYTMIETLPPAALADYLLQDYKAADWISTMRQIETIFTDDIWKQNLAALPRALVFQPHLHHWVHILSDFLPAIKRLEQALGYHAPAVQMILSGGQGLWVPDLQKILECLTKAVGQPVEQLMHKIVSSLPKDGKRAVSETADCLKALIETTPEGLAACERIYNAKHGVAVPPGFIESTRVSERAGNIYRKPVPVDTLPRKEEIPIAVIEVIVAGYLQDICFRGKAAVRMVAFLLNLEIYDWAIPTHKLQEATEYFAVQEQELLEEANRVDDIRRALKARDPKGTAKLLAELGIADSTALDEEIESLPVGVIDAVEKKGEREVEISFPLTTFTDLQRGGMGIGSAKTLIVHISRDPSAKIPPAFCVHLDTDNVDDNNHTPWACIPDSAMAPNQAHCFGKPTLFTWQMSRTLYRELKAFGAEADIKHIHDFVNNELKDMARDCIVCGKAHLVKTIPSELSRFESKGVLRRPTHCTTSLHFSSCSMAWGKIPLDVRVPEIRTDPFAVDILLTTVYAAAMSGRKELLPGCPIWNTASVAAILNALPSLKTLRTCKDISATLKGCHKDAEELVDWACTQFKGYLATATGICKIPGMPVGTHQFILANASPDLEANFASSLPKTNPQTKVLFHGTSLDRLPSILNQGLRIQSGTALQRTGAAHGKGIYMAEEPVTSFAYSPSAVSWRNSGLNNMRLLLGCEVAGSGRSVSGGIHVITEEKTVMVRYVFLLTNASYAPSANHIVPAMASAMSALRTGAV